MAVGEKNEEVSTEGWVDKVKNGNLREIGSSKIEELVPVVVGRGRERSTGAGLGGSVRRIAAEIGPGIIGAERNS